MYEGRPFESRSGFRPTGGRRDGARGAPLYGTIAAAKEAQISLRQLYHWVDDLHVVRPQLAQCGSRRFRRFTGADVSILKDIQHWIRGGYTLQAAIDLASGRRSPVTEGPR